VTKETSFVAVMPAIDEQLARTSVKSMSEALRSRLLLIDNTDDAHIAPNVECRTMAVGMNLGVARSWNVGVQYASHCHADYLLLLSQSVEFGAPGGDDLIAHMHERSPFVMMHTQHAWHTLMVARNVFRQVGLFDPIFWPAYFEDTDFLYRMGLAGLPSPRENGGKLDQVVIDATLIGTALMVRNGRVKPDFGALAAKYEAKWGGPQGKERFRHPYNDARLDWRAVGEHH
jgi:hypothetical protein